MHYSYQTLEGIRVESITKQYCCRDTPGQCWSKITSKPTTSVSLQRVSTKALTVWWSVRLKLLRLDSIKSQNLYYDFCAVTTPPAQAPHSQDWLVIHGLRQIGGGVKSAWACFIPRSALLIHTHTHTAQCKICMMTWKTVTVQQRSVTLKCPFFWKKL